MNHHPSNKIRDQEIIPEAVRVLKMEGEAILSCAKRLESGGSIGDQFRKALLFFQDSLLSGGKIVVTGVGKSGKVGQKIAATLCSTGSLAVFLHPTEGLHGDLGLIQARDTVLVLSYTGNTDEIIRLLSPLRNKGVKIVGLGGNFRSKLAESSDAWIDGLVESEACPHNLAPTTSTTLALALGDALAIALMELRGFDSASFAENHPGGSIGKRLHLKVGDLMHGANHVATVGPQASMEEVVIEATRRKLGAVLVVEGAQLLGIITDGDLRRSLQHKEKFFDLTANQVMTQKPVVAYPEMMAQTALELMENRPSQLSVLPVVDEKGEWRGLLRLHDIVRVF